MNTSLKIIFAGTPDFSVPPLRALLQSEHEVIAVYTQPDRPAGRGRKLGVSPVKTVAVEHDVSVYQPLNFKNTTDVTQLAKLNADLMVVVAYGLLLPQAVLDAPRLGCINIHASMLPRWRGAAPIQRAIAAGDEVSGVTIMQMEAGLDTGPMYLLKPVPISATETGGSLHDKLSDLGAEALMEALPGIADGTLLAEKQDDAQSVYAHKLTKQEGQVDWHQSANNIAQKVRAFNPWPVTYCDYENANMRIWMAQAIIGVSAAPGTVMAAGRAGIDVATQDGLLRITKLQLPGKRAMSAADFINSNDIQGAVLG